MVHVQDQGSDEAKRDEDHGKPAGDPAERPLVSVPVPGLNLESRIRDEVEGAFEQAWTPLEMVLSDDRSSDRTVDIMRAMAAGYSGPHRVVLNRNERIFGIAGNVDRLTEVSSGAFVLRLDGHDISLPTRAERLARTWLDSGGWSKLVFSEVMRIDHAGMSSAGPASTGAKRR